MRFGTDENYPGLLVKSFPPPHQKGAGWRRATVCFGASQIVLDPLPARRVDAISGPNRRLTQGNENRTRPWRG